MNKDLVCYTELDSIYDVRRCLIQKWMVRALVDPNADSLSDEAFVAYADKLRMEGDRLWDMYVAKDYRQRRLDGYSHPFLQLNKKTYDELHRARTVSDWYYGWYPTKFTVEFLRTILDLEMITEVPILFRRVVLHVNIYPYVLSEEGEKKLIATLQHRYGGKVEVKILNHNPARASVDFYKQFKYVLKYDTLLSIDSKVLLESVGSQMMTDTTFVVPDLLIHEDDNFTGEISDRIFAAFGLASNFFKVVPRHHSFYDYA